MANRAYLLNTSFLTSDPYLLTEKRTEPGNDYVEVAEASYRIPVPWLCCFRQTDLRSVKIPLEYEEGFDGESSVEAGLPCTSVEQALENVTLARHLFEHIAGDVDLGTMFWLNTISHLKTPPLPYLTINPLQVIFGQSDEDDAKALRDALSGNIEAIPHLMYLAGYQEGVQPYPLVFLTDILDGKLNEEKTQNAVALDVGYSSFWHLSSGSKGREDIEYSRPVTTLDGIDLGGIRAEITSLAIQHQSKCDIRFGVIAPAQSSDEQLKVLIKSHSNAENDFLLQNKLFRAKIDNETREKLERICKLYKLKWGGFVYLSEEQRIRDTSRHFDSWLERPPPPPFTEDWSHIETTKLSTKKIFKFFAWK